MRVLSIAGSGVATAHPTGMACLLLGRRGGVEEVSFGRETGFQVLGGEGFAGTVVVVLVAGLPGNLEVVDHDDGGGEMGEDERHLAQGEVVVPVRVEVEEGG